MRGNVSICATLPQSYLGVHLAIYQLELMQEENHHSKFLKLTFYGFALHQRKVSMIMLKGYRWVKCQLHKLAMMVNLPLSASR